MFFMAECRKFAAKFVTTVDHNLIKVAWILLVYFTLLCGCY
jgi:hypothetical protein